MKLLLIALFAITGAFAQTVTAVDQAVVKKFVVRSHTTFGNRVYYACDSVETAAKKLLETLGAANVDVRCAGGLDPWAGWAREAWVTASYTVKKLAEEGEEASYEEFELKSFDNCHLYKELLRGVKKSFTFERLDDGRTCFRADDSIRINGSVLK